MDTNLNRRSFIKLIGLGASAGVLPNLTRAAETSKVASKPNILFVMVDDLGKEWIKCCGAGGIETPNIDALAAGGMRFTNAYSMPQCTPTRVTLLTGQYPWRTGWVNHWDVPRWGVGYFDWKHHTTFARVLRDAGYATAAAGKWQINDFRVVPDAMDKHGFDDWCMWTGYETGIPISGERYADAYINTRQGSKAYTGKFGPDVYTNFLIEFMKKHKDEPMMLYFPMALTHGPLTNTPDEPKATNKLEAMVRYTDKLVGHLVKTIDDLKIRKRTIVIFTTDNGSSRWHVGTLNGRKVSGGKGKETETGCCNPFIVNCPGLVPRGAVTDALTDFTDMLPTFAELGGGKLPEKFPVDGKSIAKVMLGKAKDSSRQWIMALGHGAAKMDEKGVRGVDDFATRVIRDKQFKVWVDNKRTIIRLHDLKSDPFEEKNLLDSTDAVYVAARKKFQAVIDTLPKKDARPKYDPRKANSWDRKAGQTKTRGGKKRVKE
ncbi:MAG: sulfatase-like hydrolase/transferase [bacterium]|nr:sulfatase-like hydrolase/transferase [bacterium]